MNPGHQFVVSTQTHDQVGNRKDGDRLSALAPRDLPLAAATLLLSPFVPMLFMGEEYAEIAPFQFFTSHGDEGLIEAVRNGRREEFASFGWAGDVPDPQDELTFSRSKLHWEQRLEGRHKKMLDFYRELIRLRRTLPSLAHLSKEDLEVEVYRDAGLMTARRWHTGDETFIALHYGLKDLSLPVSVPAGHWEKLLDSSVDWGGKALGAPAALEGPGEQRVNLAARCVALYRRVQAHEDAA